MAASILVVDDNSDVRTILIELLVSEGYDVFSAEGGAEAIEYVEGKELDLILLDVKMPDMDGFEVCRRIKASERGKYVPIIMQTAIYGDVEDRIQGREAGADDYVTKPVDSHELLSRVAAMLRVRNLYQMLRYSERALNEKVDELEDANRRLKEMQAELIHTEKLSVMGRMAAEIAHEINNPLASMRLHADDLQHVLKDCGTLNDEAAGSIDFIMSGLSRIEDFVSRLQFFARKSDERCERVDLLGAVRGAMELMFKSATKSGIEIVDECGSEKHFVMGDRNQLEQLFLNLLINAQDSLQEVKGEGDKRIVVSLVSRESGTVRVNVKDNGPGIPGEVRDHIFEPFFTTKPEGKGSGLGLVIVKRILGSCGGKISVESEEGSGTVVAVDMPEVREDV
jgi:two-component system NtrC family sensor kinase